MRCLATTPLGRSDWHANDLSRGLLLKFKSRRKFMRRAKKFSIGSVALLLLVALAVVPVAAQQKKPNIM